MKIYVAGNPHDDKRRIRDAMTRIRKAGHTITYDWLEEMVAAKRKKLPRTPETRRAAAVADERGVRDCEALVLFDAEKGWGMYVEMGMALGQGKRVIVVRPKYDQVFFSLPQVHRVSNIGEALKLINSWDDPVGFEVHPEPEPWDWIIERCCFCRTPTRFWTGTTGKAVACCRDCARTHRRSSVPTKDEWIAKERALAKRH